MGRDILVLPCPFCGNAPTVNTTAFAGTTVDCQRCGYEFPSFDTVIERKYTKRQVLREWNRRADPGLAPVVVNRIEPLKKIKKEKTYTEKELRSAYEDGYTRAQKGLPL